MVQTRSEPAGETASPPTRRTSIPRGAAFGIMVGIVAAGVLWLIAAVIYRHLL